MNKIININLAGRMIAIDETAYEPLRTYINWLRQYFGKEEDGIEIVQDMESRIAEIFESKLRKGSPCLMTEDVQNMISIMGSPEQLHSENGYEEVPNPNGKSNSETFPQKKRLYRNELRKKVGGVCAGIADYFNIDPIIVRLAFVFFTLTWGVGILVYIVLWLVLPTGEATIKNVGKKLFRNTDKKVIAGVCSGIAAYFNTQAVFVRLVFVAPLILTIFFNIVNVFWGVERFIEGGIPTMFLLYLVLWVSIPAAKTLPEKLEMSGAKVDIQNVSNAMRNEAPIPVHSSSSNVIGTLLKVFIFIVLIVILMVLISMIIGILGLVVGYGFSPMKNEFPFYDLILTDNDTELILWTAISLLLITPLIFILFLMKSVLSGRSNGQSNYWYKVLPFLFVLGIIGVVFAGNDIFKNFKVDAVTTETVLQEKVATDTVVVSNIELESSADLRSSKINWGGHSFLIPLDDQRFAFRNVSFEIVASDNDSLMVTVSKSASGKDVVAASEYAESIAYTPAFNSQALSLSAFTTLSKANPFRFQGVKVTIAVPANKVFKIDDAFLQQKSNYVVFFNKRYQLRYGLLGDWEKETYYQFKDGVAIAL